MRALLLISVLVLLCAGCASPGAPQPPSLNIPKPVSDLSAQRRGDSVTLTWSAPTETTDGASIKRSGKVLVKRATSDSSISVTVGELPLLPSGKSPIAQKQTFKDSLAPLLKGNTPDFAIYTVEAVNSSGKSAGPSNQASVPLVPVMPPPENTSAQVVQQGVSLSWTQHWTPQNHTHLVARYAYRIMRKLADSDKPPVMVTQVDNTNEAMRVIDTSVEWEKAYLYWITPVTLWQNPAGPDPNSKGEILGDDSAPITVAVRDVFPPAAPTGLQAVFSGDPRRLFIDLAWTPNNESDLAGYSVYRRSADDQQFKKLNTELVKTPAFRDNNVQPGTKYIYAVSAVDLRGNESPKSAEASETVPRE
jgi:fibronectin type 3 domain-containing protein